MRFRRRQSLVSTHEPAKRVPALRDSMKPSDRARWVLLPRALTATFLAWCRCRRTEPEGDPARPSASSDVLALPRTHANRFDPAIGSLDDFEGGAVRRDEAVARDRDPTREL